MGDVYATPRGALDLLKLINLIVFGCLWVYGALGDILTSIVSNSHFWKRSEARDMTIFGRLLIGTLLMGTSHPSLSYPLSPTLLPLPFLRTVSALMCLTSCRISWVSNVKQSTQRVR